MAEPSFTEVLVGFARELRAAGVPVGTGDAVGYCAAAALLDPTDLVDLYWAGRTTLTSDLAQVRAYDTVFRSYYLGEHAPTSTEDPRLTLRARSEAAALLTVPETEHGEDPQDSRAKLGLVASGAEGLRAKSFAECTPEELVALRRIMSRLRLVPPRRRTRRTVPASRGARPDLHRMVRDTMRLHGEPGELRWRERRVRRRQVTLILDVSGSMADYSRALLQFAHGTRRATAKVEVFCFGTRLTRVTRELDHRRPDEALSRAAAAVFDWEGGTRIGDCLTAFVRTWARQGRCRGGIVVICSDGLDRGDPAVLAAAVEQLSRLCHRLVWVTPHAEPGDGVPSALGLRAAAPYLDAVMPGHDLRSLEDFAAALPTLSGGRG